MGRGGVRVTIVGWVREERRDKQMCGRKGEEEKRRGRMACGKGEGRR